MYAVGHEFRDHLEEILQNFLFWKCGWTNSPPFMQELKDNKPFNIIVALCESVA